MLLHLARWRWLLAGAFFWLGTLEGRAQQEPAATAPHGYDFLTVLVVESGYKDYAKIVIVPAFQGKPEISLANVEPQYPAQKLLATLTQNTATVNQLLGDLTAAGWEFLQPYAVPPASGSGGNPVATRYLFRRPRP